MLATTESGDHAAARQGPRAAAGHRRGRPAPGAGRLRQRAAPGRLRRQRVRASPRCCAASPSRSPAGSRPDEARIVLVDYRRSLLGAITTEHLIGYGTAADNTGAAHRVGRRRIWTIAARARMSRRSSCAPGPGGTGPECFVLVDDYDLVATGPINPLLPLLDHLAAGPRRRPAPDPHPACRRRRPGPLRADPAASTGTRHARHRHVRRPRRGRPGRHRPARPAAPGSRLAGHPPGRHAADPARARGIPARRPRVPVSVSSTPITRLDEPLIARETALRARRSRRC